MGQSRDKLRGGAKPAIKMFNTDNVHLQKFLAVLRSLNFFAQFSDHKKCKLERKNTAESLCSLCLIRSMVLKINEPKGHKLLKPNELVAVFPEDCLSTNTFENLKMIFSLMFTVAQHMESMIHFRVLKANEKLASSVEIPNKTKLLIICSNKGVTCNMSETLKNKGKKWHLKACLTRNGEIWFQSNHGFKNLSLEDPSNNVKNVKLAVYEDSSQLPAGDSAFIYSGKEEFETLRQCTLDRQKDRHIQKKDRHIPTEERKKDRHDPTTEARQEHDRKDKHLQTEERKKDRHLQTEERKKDRHQNSGSFRQSLKDLKCDTGMDFVCAICLE